GRIHAQRRAGDHAIRLELGRGLHYGLERIAARNHQQLHRLALLFRHFDHFAEQLPLVIGKELVFAKLVFSGAARNLTHGHDHYVVPTHVGLLQNRKQVHQIVDIAYGDQNGSGARAQAGLGDLRLKVQVEFFKRVTARHPLFLIDVLGNREHDEKDGREENTVDGGEFFRKQVHDRRGTEDHGGYGQADWDLHAANPEVDGELVFLIVTLVTQHEHAESLEEEAPDHAEGISFAEQIDIPAAERDGNDLQDGDDVDDAVSGA